MCRVLPSSGAPGMGDNTVMKARYRLGSRKFLGFPLGKNGNGVYIRVHGQSFANMIRT